MRLYPEEFFNIISVVPPVEEQQVIATYLDQKTVLIDDTIQKKQRLIKLLLEERTALVNKAVIRGLNPDVKLKPSGVEWLGDVPKSWSVTRLKWLIDNIEQGWSPQCESRPAEMDEWGVLKVGCVNYGKFTIEENKAIPKDLEPVFSLEVKNGDLLMSRANTKELVGSAALINKTRNKLMLCDKLYRIRHKETVNPKFLELQLNSKGVRIQIEQDTTGASSSMQNISQELVRELIVVDPPLYEQNEIVETISRTTKEIDQATLYIQKEINLLQEYRTALINEVVTGKRCVIYDTKPDELTYLVLDEPTSITVSKPA